MTILITGYNGYIGSHIYEYLIKNRYKVYGIDYDILDLKNYKKLKKYIKNKKIETIIHLASYKKIEESIENSLLYYENNIIIMINILKIIKEYKIKNLIFSSSASILNNDSVENITKLKNSYAKTKLICEEMIKDYNNNHDFNYTILRYYNPYGFTIKKNIIDFINKNNSIYFNIQKYLLIDNSKPLEIYGNDYNTRDGTCIRDYIFIDDLVKEHIKYINNNKNNIINIGSKQGKTVLEFIKMFSDNINYVFKEKRKGDIEISICN